MRGAVQAIIPKRGGWQDICSESDGSGLGGALACFLLLEFHGVIAFAPKIAAQNFSRP